MAFGHENLCRMEIGMWLLVLASLVVTDASHWDYVDEHGPEHWAALFPDGCAGRHQSPIDIRPEKTVYDPALKDFVIFYDPPSPDSKFILHNNGHTIQVNTEGKFFVSNGGLHNVYSTAQFHFHWGHHDKHGSEHTIDGHADPIELHIVNWNSEKYSSIAEAVVQPDGLAVLGIMFEVSDEDNAALNPIIDVMMKVRDPDDNNKLEIDAVSMRAFLPERPERYYRYKGSLTTPGCFESVTWTVFAEKLPISRRQLRVFRQALKSSHHRRRRSIDSRIRAVQDVLSELGIENNPVERSRFKRALMAGHENDSHADQHNGKAEHADPDEGHEPLDHHGNTHEDHHVNGQDDHKHDDEDDDERETLVNNYRPVQPLHGRTVYRSFPSLEDPVPVDKTVWEKKKNEVKELVDKLYDLLQYFTQDHQE